MRDISSPLDGFASPFGPGRRTLTNLLFGQNEPGFTFEPWDITTLYQDRAGTTPVTAAGQSVGLRLDKSKGLVLGSELGFATLQVSDLTVNGGSVVVTDLGDRLRLTRTAAAGGPTQAQVSSGVVSAGQYYRASFTLLATGTSNNAYIGVNNGGGTDFILSAYYAGASAQSRLQIATAEGTGRLILRLAVSRGANPASSIEGDWIEISKTYSVKSLAGNHEVAVSDAKRGVYGWMPKTGRRNLLTYTEQFDNAVWVKSRASILADNTTDPNGTTTADRVTVTTEAIGGITLSQSPTITGLSVTGTVYLKAGDAQWAYLGFGATERVWFNLVNGVVGTQTGATGTIFSVGNGWYRCRISATATANTFNVAAVCASDNTTSSGGILDKFAFVWGAQLEVGSTATAYQRVVSQYDITEAGVPTCYYVQADGVDDAYVTPTITPNTDKVQVFAGVRKLSDAAAALFLEYSANVNSNNGAFVVGPGNFTTATGPNYHASSKGTVISPLKTPASYASPITNVVSALLDISGDSNAIRVNGTQVAQSSGDQGTGNFLAYPAYIYGRGGTSLPFNGLDFGHAVRFGPNLDAATIARVEALIARNTPEVTL